MKSIAERIKEAQAAITKIDEEAARIKGEAENVDLSDEQASQVAALADEREGKVKSLANLEALEKLVGQRAEPAAPAVHRSGRLGIRADEPKGTVIVRAALASVFAYVERKDAVQVARERFGHDARIEAVCKTAVGVADTTTAGWAKELVQQDVQGFVEALVPFSVYAALASRGISIDFGDAGSVSIPYRAGTNTDLAGAFVGENGVIPVKRGTLGAAVMNRYKMAVISAITKELSRSSTPQAEALIRRMMLEDTGVALDKALLDANAAVAGVRPAGLLSAVAPIAASAAATPIEKAIADLSALLGAMAASGNGSRPVFVVNPAQRLRLGTMYSAGEWMFRDELNGGRLMGVEVVSSLNVPAGDVILIDAANFATALGSPEFDTSESATLVMANADAVAPTQATSAADPTIVGTAEQVPPDGGLKVRDPAQQAAGKVGEAATAISMFQQWSIALRTVMPVSWATLRTGTVQWVDNVTW